MGIVFAKVAMPFYRLSNWAGKVSLVAAELMVFGGVISLFYSAPNLDGVSGQILGAYSIVIGVFGILFHYPWKPLGSLLLLLQQSYILNAILNIAFGAFLFVQLPTQLAGILMMFAAVLYLIAAYRQEEKLTVEQLTK